MRTQPPVAMLPNSRRCWISAIGSDDEALLLDLEQLTYKGSVSLRVPLVTAKCFQRIWHALGPLRSIRVGQERVWTSVVWTR